MQEEGTGRTGRGEHTPLGKWKWPKYAGGRVALRHAVAARTVHIEADWHMPARIERVLLKGAPVDARAARLRRLTDGAQRLA